MADLTLRDVTDEILTLDTFIAEAEGELTPELEQLLTDVTAKLETKVESVGRFILQETQRCAAIKEEEERLAKRRLAIEHRIGWLKESYLREMMAKLGQDKLKGTLCTVALQKNPPKLVGELAGEQLAELSVLLPDLVSIVPASVNLNRRGALDYLKAGNEIPGLAVEQTLSVRIR